MLHGVCSVCGRHGWLNQNWLCPNCIKKQSERKCHKKLTQGDEMRIRKSIADLANERKELIKRIAPIHFNDMTLDQLRQISKILKIK